MLNAIILDDEYPGRDNLRILVEEYCRHICIAGAFETAGEARKFIAANPVDVVFLDVSMPGEDGFAFLQSVADRYHFQVVFVTAHADYAIKAIRASAADYLLKPVKISDLLETEQRLIERIEQNTTTHQQESLKVFIENLDKSPALKKMIIHHRKGFNVIDLSKVVRLEADGNYTTIFTACPDKIITTKSIKDFEELLDPNQFVRVHKSHIINLQYMEQYIQDDTGYALLTGGHKVEVSRRRNSVLFGHLSDFVTRNKTQ